MANHWMGCCAQGMVLSQSEFEKMLDAYAEKNPSHADDVNIVRGYAGAEDMEFIKSKYAGDPMPDLHELNWSTDKAVDKIMYFTELLPANVYMEGIRFWPFYKPNGQVNRLRWNDSSMANFCIHPMQNTNDTVCYFLESDRQLDNALTFERKPYDSYGDFVQEFKDKMEAYLPEDFVWDAHLGTIAYAVYA